MSINTAIDVLAGPSVNPSTKIYQYQPDQILPLIKSHLPASILLYGILATPPTSDSLPPRLNIRSTIPHLSKHEILPLNSEGTIILQVSSKSGDHLRVFDTLESRPGIQAKQLEEGQERVVNALREIQALSKEYEHQIGGLHERWIPEVMDKLGYGLTPTRQGVWLPPQGWKNDVQGVEGYLVDIGREADLSSFSDNSDIDREVDYYRSRLPYSTVIRPIVPSPTQSAQSVCRVLTHANGSIGTLSTDPDHRRKGLAQWVVRAHLASGRGWIGTDDSSELEEKDKWSYAVIFDRNLASQGMFRGMGWVRGWGRAWVTIGEELPDESV